MRARGARELYVCAHLSDCSPLLTPSLYRTAYENIEITTRSHPDAFPSALRQKRKTQTKQHAQGDQGTLVRVPRVHFPHKY